MDFHDRQKSYLELHSKERSEVWPTSESEAELPVRSPISMILRPLAAKFLIGVDAGVCSGCLCCQLACSLFHEGECNLALARLYVFHDPFAGKDNLIEVCKQCLAPSCLYACPVPGAFTIDEATGARVINEEKCVGCGRCAEACPLNDRRTIIRYNPDKRTYVKCDLCKDREAGPLCVEVCPWGALKTLKQKGVER